MACINSDGTLTVVARQMLAALATVDDAEEIRLVTGLPMYRVRSGLREMIESGLVEIVDEKRHVLTARGRQMIGGHV
jgi:helix-turn-helix protein